MMTASKEQTKLHLVAKHGIDIGTHVMHTRGERYGETWEGTISDISLHDTGKGPQLFCKVDWFAHSKEDMSKDRMGAPTCAVWAGHLKVVA